MFEFGQIFLMQTTTTTTGIAALDAFVAIIGTFASIAIAVGAVVHSVSLRPQLASHKAALSATADFLKDVGTHVTQSKADIATLAEVTYNMLPEQAAKIVNAQNVRIAELDKKLQAAEAQISKIPTALDHI